MTQYKIYAIGIAIILVLCTLLASMQQKISKLKIEKDQVIKYSLIDESQIIWYKNKLNKETARADVAELSFSNAAKLLTTERLNFIKQFEGVKKNARNINTVLEVTAKSTTDVELVSRDSLEWELFEFKDEFNNLKVVSKNDTISITHVVEVPLQGAIFWQRKKILGFIRIGKKTYEIHMTSPNPNVHLTNLSSIKVSKLK